ncbi:MAG: AbrB/MazE/SpoVT family DNA-binding domain-containing protein [Planctomycetota bacterium]|nr:AbrB/MazE/SpoVT family DNA-binding domain-containing protein [Planctomycetota bacterium]
MDTKTMVKHLTKHGNSYALVIDKPILELIQATGDTPFEIISDGRSLVLTPVRDAAIERKFTKAVEMVHKRFGRAMKKLAK